MKSNPRELVESTKRNRHMLRSLALTASLLAIVAVPALSQTHSGSHAQRPHGPGHVRPDSATHAAMHALFHGSWTGTLTSSRGASSGMELSVARDSVRGVTLTVNTDWAKRGFASGLALGDDKQLRWTQDLSGTKCKAHAALSAATKTTREALNGKLSCDGVESSFTLHRKAS